MKHEKDCEWCGKRYVATRSHSRTCSSTCRFKLHKKGFSNKKVMNLVVMFPTREEAVAWIKKAKAGCYNLCVEENGFHYVYRYTDEYVKANKETFSSCKPVK